MLSSICILYRIGALDAGEMRDVVDLGLLKPGSSHGAFAYIAGGTGEPIFTQTPVGRRPGALAVAAAAVADTERSGAQGDSFATAIAAVIDLALTTKPVAQLVTGIARALASLRVALASTRAHEPLG